MEEGRKGGGRREGSEGRKKEGRKEEPNLDKPVPVHVEAKPVSAISHPSCVTPIRILRWQNNRHGVAQDLFGSAVRPVRKLVHDAQGGLATAPFVAVHVRVDVQKGRRVEGEFPGRRKGGRGVLQKGHVGLHIFDAGQVCRRRHEHVQQGGTS